MDGVAVGKFYNEVNDDNYITYEFVHENGEEQ